MKLIASTKVRWLCALCLAVALVAAAAVLVFSSGGPAGSAAFSTASIGLTLNSQTGQLAFTDLSFENMKPGDEVYAPLEVMNTGPTSLTYAMSSIESGDAMFADALSIGIAVVKDGSCTPGTYQGGTSVYMDAAGLSNATISGRTLPAGTREYLCFHVRLAPDASTDLETESAAATFNFTAFSARP